MKQTVFQGRSHALCSRLSAQHVKHRVVFPGSPEHIKQSTELVADTFERAQAAFNAELAQMTLDKLLESKSVQHGAIDWQTLD